MKFISALKAERSITTLLSEPNCNTPTAKRALASLRKTGPGAINVLIDALATADKDQTLGIVEALTTQVSSRTFPYFAEGLEHSNQHSVAGVCWALSSSRNYDPKLLLKLLEKENVSAPAVMDILNAHMGELKFHDVLNKAYDLEPRAKASLFKLVDKMADEHAVPELLTRLGGHDKTSRMLIIKVLSRFSRPDVSIALQGLLKDTDRGVRQAALGALAHMDGEQDIEVICSLLDDPDIQVQNSAVDLIIKLNKPGTVDHLIEILKSESEFSRRSAVEVLNAIADTSNIKHLLAVIGDNDWWVRSRACDALAAIGGPKVMSAVMQLIKDKDENIRRSAIEILNQTKDKAAVGHLIEATKDTDWWVSERAADTLAEIGSTEAVPAIAAMLSGNPKSVPAALRALAKFGDPSVISEIQPLLSHAETEIRAEAITTLSLLVDETNIDSIRAHILGQQQTADKQTAEAITQALARINHKASETTSSTTTGDLAEATSQNTSGTLLLDNAEMQQIVATQGMPAFDIEALNPGDTIEGRYKYIEQIGKGAFGTVILVEDNVVEEQLILKFLNSNVSTDEEMLQRFVHELRYSRKITHQNVIRIFDFLHLSGHYAISMEYFPSHTLSREVSRHKPEPMPFSKAIGWAKDIANGMASAHEVGVIHRDLKPANLLIDDDGLLKIVDFGVASVVDSGGADLTKTGYVIGSPKYMAPEQILGKKVDHRSDIYSLGVIFYEMLTGKPPYTKGDHMAVMYQHVQGKAKRCEELNPNIPPELAAIVNKAMEVNKTKRYSSMEELRVALDNIDLS
ncbi:MAG: protein kinase domain-containing protein [Gammaproteobacteria bacterium]